MRAPIILAFIVLLLSGCSSEQLYATGRNAQRMECVKQADGASRDQCLKDAGMSYDAYRKEADSVRR